MEGATLIGDAKEVMREFLMCAMTSTSHRLLRLGEREHFRGRPAPHQGGLHHGGRSLIMTTNPLDARNLRDRVQALATDAGVRQWDLGAACSDDCSVQVDRGEAKQMKAAQRSSVTVRVWNSDGLVGITSTTDLTDAGLARALEGAQQASAFGNPDDVPQFSPLATAPLPHLDRPLKPRQGILPMLQNLKTAEAELLSRHPAIQTVPYNGLAESLSTSLSQ